MNIKPIQIEGNFFYTIKQFAILTNRSEQSVRLLITKGNRLRKLTCRHYFDKPFICANELTEYPFTVSGRNNDEVYHYDKQGELVGI